MGDDSTKSAVNPVGETWEVRNLYVADASVFPTATGVPSMVCKKNFNEMNRKSLTFTFSIFTDGDNEYSTLRFKMYS
jgi:hypothetical protein